MASRPTQTKHNLDEPAASSGPKKKAKLAAANLRIDPNLPYMDDDPSMCELVRGSPVTTVPPLPAKSKKRKRGPSAVPMDSLLAPKAVFTPPLPFRHDDPDWRPPRFDRGSRSHCPKKLDLSSISRKRYIVKDGRRVYAARGTASLLPWAIPSGVPLNRAPATHAPQAKGSEVSLPETEIPSAKFSRMKVSLVKTALVMSSASADPVLGPMPLTDPESPIYSPSSDSLPEIMTRQRRKKIQKKQATRNGMSYRQVNQDQCSQASVTESPCDEDSIVYQQEERDECNCSFCQDCCLILATIGMGMTVLLSVSTAISKVGQWLVSLTPPNDY